MAKTRIGGGAKKVLYTLDTVRRIGLLSSVKALNAKNACKACAFGMGGQRGGMTNELDEYPSVCNKSVQAQSTDIQLPIPEEVFAHNLADLQELDAKELEHLGRLGSPIYKPAGADAYAPISWDDALDLAAERLAAVEPDRSFFYASGRSSNEAGFLFQLLARAYGTNNVSNCSFYCHQATGVALSETIGTGTSTVELADLNGCDLIVVIGANPSSNHPRFIHKLKACRDRGGEVVMINPAREPGLVKFASPKSARSLLVGGDEIASFYVQPRIGGDISLFKGIAKAILAASGEARAFIDAHTEGFDAFAADINAQIWADIEAESGVPRAEIERLADIYMRSTSAVFAWGMGMTHHAHGVENIEYISNLALMRGMIGRPNAGLLPLRGHSNVQGVGTIGVKPVLSQDVVDRMEETLGLSLPKGVGMDTMAAMEAAGEGKIDAAVLLGGNLFAANPDSDWAARALDQIGFRLCLTTTLNASHVFGVESGEMLVLPVAARDEEWEPTTQESMFNYVRFSDGGITRLADVRPESAILADIGARLLPDGPIDFDVFKRHRSVRQAIAAIVPGMEALADIDVAKREFHVRNRLIHTPEFQTSNSKARFKTHVSQTPVGSGDEVRPFTLMTVRSEGQFNSIIYEHKDTYRGTDTRWSVLMNKQDIDAAGLKPGDRADLRSEHGVMTGVKVYPFDLPRGDVMAYYPEANVLTSRAVDPRSKTPAFKSTPIAIAPASGA